MRHARATAASGMSHSMNWGESTFPSEATAAAEARAAMPSPLTSSSRRAARIRATTAAHRSPMKPALIASAAGCSSPSERWL